MKLKDSEYKNSSLVSQIDRKNTKEKRKYTKKDGELKICPPVAQIDHKNVKINYSQIDLASLSEKILQ